MYSFKSFASTESASQNKRSNFGVSKTVGFEILSFTTIGATTTFTLIIKYNICKIRRMFYQ